MTRAKVAGAADEAAAAAVFVAVIVVVVVEVDSEAVAVETREEGKVFLCELYIVLRQYVRNIHRSTHPVLISIARCR